MEILQAIRKAQTNQAGGRNLLMQYLPTEERKTYRQGDFTLFNDRPAPNDPAQQELKRKYTEEREGDKTPMFYNIARGICAHCGQEFYQRTPLYYGRQSLKYCSERCRNDAYIARRRQRHKAALNKICTVCGRAYTAKKTDSLYCGAACKQKAYRQARKSEI